MGKTNIVIDLKKKTVISLMTPIEIKTVSSSVMSLWVVSISDRDVHGFHNKKNLASHDKG